MNHHRYQPGIVADFHDGVALMGFLVVGILLIDHVVNLDGVLVHELIRMAAVEFARGGSVLVGRFDEEQPVVNLVFQVFAFLDLDEAPNIEVA